MREYCFFHTSWHKACKGYPIIIKQILESNFKRQMSREEGLLFVGLMKRIYNHTNKRRSKNNV